MIKEMKNPKPTATATRALTASEINAVAGGVNPQPLPPAGRSRA